MVQVIEGIFFLEQVAKPKLRYTITCIIWMFGMATVYITGTLFSLSPEIQGKLRVVLGFSVFVGLYNDKNQFNDPNNPECTTPTTLPVYDVGFLKFANIQGVDGFKNIVVTGDVASGTTTDLDFTNVVFTGDVSGIDNTGTYRGVIHFKDEPMKDIYTEYALIKIDTPPTGKRANITGGIMDFRDIKDRLDDLTSDSDYDISNHLSLNGANKIARGYFKDEKLKDYIEPRVETEAASFADTYVEPIDKEYMKTLSDVEKAANEEKLSDLFNNHPKSTEARQ
jgi:hypothetical protein